MNVLFLTMSWQKDINAKGLYTDLVRKFRDEGHRMFVVCPSERRRALPTRLEQQDGVSILLVRTLNLQKTNVVEKGLGQLLMEPSYLRAIRRYFRDVRFDLILYSTPPVTFNRVIRSVRKRNPEAVSYLMLKDIFPQNAVDLGMFSKTGLLYRVFRRKEQTLYRISDHIGCMSPANVRYLLAHNPSVPSQKVGICPNSYDSAGEVILSAEQREEVRRKYGLPLSKPVFIYGGNLGKPQGIPFLIECLKANASRGDCHFVIVGDGTDYPLLKTWHDEAGPSAVSVFRSLPREEFDMLAAACDIGLIFLDYRFTIPNFPSRLLSYMMCRKPVLACTDPVSDVGPVIESAGCGCFCLSNDVAAFTQTVDAMLTMDADEMGEKAYRYYLDNFTVAHSYGAIMTQANV